MLFRSRKRGARVHPPREESDATILPFSFNSELELVVDPSLLLNDDLYFNAARVDRSMALKASDYVALAKPCVERIAER